MKIIKHPNDDIQICLKNNYKLSLSYAVKRVLRSDVVEKYKKEALFIPPSPQYFINDEPEKGEQTETISIGFSTLERAKEVLSYRRKQLKEHSVPDNWDWSIVVFAVIEEPVEDPKGS